MSAFWIVGIVLNVSLTGLAIWWVLKEMRPKVKAHEAEEDRDENA